MNVCHFRTMALWLLCIWPFFAGTVWAAEDCDPPLLMTVPPSVNAPENMQYLQQAILDMLETRLQSGQEVKLVNQTLLTPMLDENKTGLDQQTVRRIAGKLKADYAVWGSLSVFGKSICMDFRLLHVSCDALILTFSRNAAAEEELIGKIDELAKELRMTIIDKSGPARAKTMPLHSKKADRPALSLATEKEIIMPKMRSDFIRGPEIQDEITSIAAGDVDGDKRSEIICVGSSRLRIFRYDPKKLHEVAVIKGRGNFISVDTADLNKNGIEEIFVTNFDENAGKVASFVLEWNGSSFEYITKRLEFFFRSHNIPSRGKVLFGQEQGMSGPFGPGVFEIAWSNGRYEKKIPWNFKGKHNIFEAAPLVRHPSESGKSLGYSRSKKINVYDSEGRVESVTNEKYGPSATRFEAPAVSGYTDSDVYFLEMRIFPIDWNGDGIDEVLVGKNVDITGTLFAATRYLEKGHLELLKWEEGRLTSFWQSRDFSKYISDFTSVDLDGDGMKEIIAANVVISASAFKSGSSVLFIFKAE